MKQFSAKRSIQILGHVLESYGINQMIISPGSRNAPLAIHFSELDSFFCYSIIDERSAAFVGMGMAKSIKKPVAISCTSGSAAVNYYPAIVEAFYQNIPLLILTADRPGNYIDIFDGQTIRQKNLFQQHSYGDFELLEDDEENADEQNYKTIQKAVELCIEKNGPVHINIPLSEPLYEMTTETPNWDPVEKKLSTDRNNYEIPKDLINQWNDSEKTMILAGTLDDNTELESLLNQLVKNHSVVALIEANSNLYNEKSFNHIDRYIFGFSDETFKHYIPDLLITIGQNVVSKKIKQLLRKAHIKNHWHIDPFWQPDTYFSLSEKIETHAEFFFRKLIKNISLEPKEYYNLWNDLKNKKDKNHDSFCENIPFSDFSVFQMLSESVPEKYVLHISNSTPIRYTQLFNFSKRHKIFCNRGASGIDGSTSTAMGFAMMSKDPVLFITGELSFFYDINALWNNYIPPYTRIIVINNGGGDIFKIIPGPTNTNALDEFIATKHKKNAELLAKHFGFNYFRVNEQESLHRALSLFFNADAQPKILEIDTSEVDNAQIIKDYFSSL